MNSNPFPEDINSGEIKPIEEFDPNTPIVQLGIDAQRILANIPMHKRVEYVSNSTEPELADERKQLERLFNEKRSK